MSQALPTSRAARPWPALSPPPRRVKDLHLARGQDRGDLLPQGGLLGLETHSHLSVELSKSALAFVKQRFELLEPGAKRARLLLVHVGTRGDPASMLPTIHSVAREVDPQVPLLRARTFQQLRERNAHRERLMTLALSTVGWIALALRAFGLYGLVAYAVVTRTREIGIRAALGAQRAQVVMLFLGRTTRLVLTGGVLGLGIAIASSPVFENQLYGVDALSPAAHVRAVAALAGVSLLALLIPLRRALQVNPAVALRSE